MDSDAKTKARAQKGLAFAAIGAGIVLSRFGIGGKVLGLGAATLGGMLWRNGRSIGAEAQQAPAGYLNRAAVTRGTAPPPPRPSIGIGAGSISAGQARKSDGQTAAYVRYQNGRSVNVSAYLTPQRPPA